MHLLKLFVGELQLTEKVADPLCKATPRKQMTTCLLARTRLRGKCYEPESMNTVDDLGDVLLVVQVCQLEDEALRQSYFAHEIEERVDVVGMTKVEFGGL